ncbi:MAG: DUF4175 domain-containing protein [Bacteroidota bacterium]
MKLVPPPPEVDSALWAGLARRLRLAWAVLLWERLWPLLLPPLCVAGLFVAFALFDVAPLLPVWLHGLVLAAAGGGLSFLLLRGALRLTLPSWDEAARRLERDSGLDHRPLAVLSDRPAAADDPIAHALWQTHLRRAAGRLGHLRLNLPHPNMAARDPWGLRAAVLLVLVIALTGARDDAPRRLVRALTPAVSGSIVGPDAVEVWITPPAYTRMAPLLLKPGSGAVTAVPAGSTVLAVLSGGWGAARLGLDGGQWPFQRQSDGSQRVEAKIDHSGRLSIRQSLFTVAAWDLQVAADALPSAAFAQPPEGGERGRLRLAVSASDDYGLAHVRVLVRRLGMVADEPPLVVELPLSGGQPRSAEISGWFDLTAHPWAGLPVSLQPVAEDAAGQSGAGAVAVITLPERHFTNPVAAAVVEQRRAVTESVAGVPGAVTLLDRIAIDPELFNDDLKTFLMLRAARHALDSDTGFDLAEVQDLMWQAALRIEDGDLSSAERALDEARRALEQAVENGASSAELQALLDRFQQALERYTQALAEQMGKTGQAPLPQADGRVIGEDELRQMVDTLRDMAEAGARDALRQMLAEMGQVLDGLQAGAGQQQQANGSAQEGLRQLRDLARKQQALMDDSQRQGAAGNKGANGTQAAQAQENLRRALAEATRKLADGLGEAPAPLAEADGSMAAASGQLNHDRWNDAADSQAQALASLQQATREALAQLGNGQGMPGMVTRDPLGRSRRSGAVGDDGTRVPDRGELQRSRQLLDEIRRRAGEVQRPEPERDYLKRLLKQF